jgi:prophage regulatory protein
MCVRVLRRSQVLARTGLSNTTLYELLKVGSFPKSFKLLPPTIPRRETKTEPVGWLESEVDQWIADRVRAARGDPLVAA